MMVKRSKDVTTRPQPISEFRHGGAAFMPGLKPPSLVLVLLLALAIMLSDTVTVLASDDEGQAP